MVRSTWAALTADLSPADLALLTAYRDMCRKLEGAEEEVHASSIQYRMKRIFTSAYVKSHWLEIGVDLLREAKHPLLRTSFASTKKVFTHRLTLRSPDQVDASVRALLEEARDTVGPGTR
jgi:hypothetical protein